MQLDPIYNQEIEMSITFLAFVELKATFSYGR